LGADDINGMLRRHQSVERNHFKLWLTSVTVLQRVLHNAELGQTDFEIERIRRKLPLFVQSDAFPRAMEILERTNVVILSGVPGIGKTTLAEMLLFAHLNEGYEPIAIRSDIAEGKKLFRKGVKQIFYFDDFLGQTFLGDRPEYVGANHDSAIIDFIEMSTRSSGTRFVLTTREHILRTGFQVSERLARSTIQQHRCVLELRDYTLRQRARILYNHLYFSDLPQEHKNALLENDFVLKIVRHAHFSPRLVEWLSSYARVRNVPALDYPKHVSKLLASPEQIWSHAFRVQISEAARNVLLSQYGIGESPQVTDLETAFHAFHRYRANAYHRAISPTDFRNALQELDGTFLVFERGAARFLNPSIREFIASVISGDKSAALDLLHASVQFRQIVSIYDLSRSRTNAEISAPKHTAAFCDAAERLLTTEQWRWERLSDGRLQAIYVDVGRVRKASFLASLADFTEVPRALNLAGQVAHSMVATWEKEVPEFSAALDFLDELPSKKWLFANGGREIYRHVLTGLISNTEGARAWEWVRLLSFVDKALDWTDDDDHILDIGLKRYQTMGVNDERSECDTIDEMSELRDALDGLSNTYGLNFRAEIEQLDEEIAVKEDARERFEEGSGYTGPSRPDRPENVSDTELRDLFSTLRDQE
jgi:hypothetical protein